MQPAAGMNVIAIYRRNHNRIREWDEATYEAKEECPHPTVANKW